MYKEDRFMTVWAVIVIGMIIIGLPTAILWGMHASHTERNQVEKPTASYELAEYTPEFHDFESTKYRQATWNTPHHDAFYRLFDGGQWYFDASKHTYQVAQTITGVLLGTEGTNINYITPYVVTSVCQHGEYNFIEPSCCFQ